MKTFRCYKELSAGYRSSDNIETSIEPRTFLQFRTIKRRKIRAFRRDRRKQQKRYVVQIKIRIDLDETLRSGDVENYCRKQLYEGDRDSAARGIERGIASLFARCKSEEKDEETEGKGRTKEEEANTFVRAYQQ